MTFPSDLEIAREARLKPMAEIAAKMGIGPHLLEPYGYDVAKIKLDALDELKDRPKAKYVVVSAVTPTPLGEGKTTTTVGLGDALGKIGKRATVAIRQPSTTACATFRSTSTASRGAACSTSATGSFVR